MVSHLPGSYGEIVARSAAAIGLAVVVSWAPAVAGEAAGKGTDGKGARAILSASCVKCHGPIKQKGGLRLDSREGLLANADSGSAAIVSGKPDSSELIRRVTSKDKAERMPPEGKPLTAAQVETLRQWIQAGAAWPKGQTALRTSGKSELVVTEEDRKHWSFRPLSMAVEAPRGPAGLEAIDRFIVARLAGKHLALSPRADARTLIRRATFDVTGLPPTPEEVAAFTQAKNPAAAYEALVDRLLASPRYGERWGRHWLDVARYADSSGYESDYDRPNAYHYRDFVIKALNADLPFDKFVRRQLAGDEIAPDDPLALSATGFLAAGPCETLPANLLEEERLRGRFNGLDDMVSTIGSAFLGLTIACARCHDHKFDPIPTRDYYRIMAVLNSGDRSDVKLGSRAEIEASARRHRDWTKQRQAAEARWKKWMDDQRAALGPKLRQAKIDKLRISAKEKTLLKKEPNSPAARSLAKKHKKALAITDDEVRQASEGSARREGDRLAKELETIRGKEPKPLPAAFAFKDLGATPAKSWLFKRGDFHDRSTPVEIGFVTVASRGKAPEEYWKEARAASSRNLTGTTFQRRALAEWITDSQRGAGPLLARVIVNRVWQHHFGAGLVRTPNDFGSRGDRPTHPKLLEWLAADFVSHGWKLKRLHRMILLSEVYRQSSAFDLEKAKADPENKLLARRRPMRIEAEALRDAMLAASGTLNPEMFGPAFRPPIPADAMVARNLQSPYPKNIPDTSAVHRRSVYMFHKRVIPHPLLQAFDSPDAQQCEGLRSITTVVPQALAILNDPFVRHRSADFAGRLLKEAGGDLKKCVERAYRLALSRGPSSLEGERGIEFLASQQRKRRERQPRTPAADIKRLALTDYCQVLFGLNEFLYVD